MAYRVSPVQIVKAVERLKVRINAVYNNNAAQSLWLGGLKRAGTGLEPMIAEYPD